MTTLTNASLSRLSLVIAILCLPALVWADCSSMENLLKNEPSGLTPCPCTAAEAADDNDFSESNHNLDYYHPGADSCYRTVDLSQSGSGQQCCYDEDGSIMVGPPGGGTADRYGPVGLWRMIQHYFYDVRPWKACCTGYATSDDCETYYRYRPSDDCSLY